MAGRPQGGGSGSGSRRPVIVRRSPDPEAWALALELLGTGDRGRLEVTDDGRAVIVHNRPPRHQ